MEVDPVTFVIRLIELLALVGFVIMISTVFGRYGGNAVNATKTATREQPQPQKPIEQQETGTWGSKQTGNAPVDDPNYRTPMSEEKVQALVGFLKAYSQADENNPHVVKEIRQARKDRNEATEIGERQKVPGVRVDNWPGASEPPDRSNELPDGWTWG